MRKVKLKKWKSPLPDSKEEIEEDLLTVLNYLIANMKPETIPRGIDQARIFSRIRRAFDKADESGELCLEEQEYNFLKKNLEDDMPSVWGMNPEIFDAVEEFLSLKSE